MYHPHVLFVRIVKLPRAGNVGATKVIFWEQSEKYNCKQHNIIVMLLIYLTLMCQEQGARKVSFTTRL